MFEVITTPFIVTYMTTDGLEGNLGVFKSEPTEAHIRAFALKVGQELNAEGIHILVYSVDLNNIQDLPEVNESETDGVKLLYSVDF